MKKFQLITIVAALLLCNACIKDLDTVPLYENDFIANAAYNSPESYKQGLAKIYSGFVLVGQDGEGSPEISINDGGASELNRAWWSVQELSTDAAKVAWVDDAWTREVNTNTWTTLKNDAIYAIFARTTLIVSLVNEYLRQTNDERLAERGVDDALKADIQKYRAEARLVRAYVYWMGMDVFGNMPFFTEDDPVGTFLPPEKKRADLFTWIEDELTALIADPNLAAARANTYPRVDKGVAWGLLARMYINAEVYTGTVRWSDAKTAAANVIAAGYGLAAEYAHLFMSDNGENTDTRKELIYAVAYDKVETRSYGGTTFLTAAVLSADDLDSEARNNIGTNDGWGGPRTTFAYAQKFGISNPDTSNATYDCNDKRAMFHIKSREEVIANMSVFTQGWSVVKYSNLKSTETPPVENSTFSSTDYPLMRLAEIYLIYAEAVLREAGGASGSDATALGYLNTLRTRAFKTPETPLASYNLDYIIEERARELMWEGHRRTDLIRFGLYTSGDYLWQWKGGNPNGQALDKRFNLCPYPVDDVRLNENLTPTEGYAY
jgi:hypothetical protein